MTIPHWCLRFVLWVVAGLFCILPVGLSVAKDPASVGRLLVVTNYLAVARDMMLCAIAVLAVGLVDGFDCIADKVHADPVNGEAISWACMLVLAIVMQLVVYSFWSASMDQHTIATTWPYLVCAIASSLVARLSMLS